MTSDVDLSTDVHGTIARSTAWLSITSLTVRALNLLRMLVLARLLAPSDFGLFGVAIAIIGLGMILGDIGAGAYLMYKSRDDQAGITAAFWLNVAFAFVVATVLAVSGELVASFYKNDSLAPIVAVLAVGAWFTILGFFPRDLLRTRSLFGRIGAVEIFAAVASFSTALVLAALHLGVWALVWSAVLYQLVATISWHIVSRWRPSAFPSWTSFRHVFSFAGWYTGAALAWYLAASVDNLLVGKLLGVTALGFYVLAYNLASVPLMLVVSPFATVIFPKLARLPTRDSAFWDSYEKSSRFMATLGIPICAAMAVAAPDLVAVFGSKWSAAVVPFQILLAYMAIRLLMVDPYNAQGRFGASFAAGMITTALEIAAIVALAVPWGLPGAAIAVLVVVGSAHIAGLAIVGTPAALGRRIRGSIGLIALAGSAAGIGIAIPHLGAATASRYALQLPLAAIAGVLVLLVLAYAMRTYLRALWSEMVTARE